MYMYVMLAIRRTATRNLLEFRIFFTYLKYGTVRFSVDLEWVISWDIRLDLGCNKQSKTTAGEFTCKLRAKMKLK